MNLDKFYTKPEIAKKCFDLIKSQIKEKDLIIEPSAGNGAFIKYIIANKNNYLFYDIKPENDKIIKQNYLKLNTTIFMKRKNKIHVIGNPPFGRQSSLAIKFIKKSAEFADTISFILPKSFKKTSMINKIPLNFHLFLQKDLPKNSFLKEGIILLPASKEKDVPKTSCIPRVIEPVKSNFKGVPITIGAYCLVSINCLPSDDVLKTRRINSALKVDADAVPDRVKFIATLGV
jgi:hypothetical protein